jgi:hypothetical protein
MWPSKVDKVIVNLNVEAKRNEEYKNKTLLNNHLDNYLKGVDISWAGNEDRDCKEYKTDGGSVSIRCDS